MMESRSMFTPSTASDDTNIPPKSSANSEVSQKKRVPLLSIPVTISVGLLIAAGYLGSRIVTAHRPVKATVVTVAPPVPINPRVAEPVSAKPSVQPDVKPVAVVETAPKSAPKTERPGPKPASVQPIQPVADDGVLPMITPQPHQRYIQVGALVAEAEATHRFVNRLRSENLDPHVAPGPTPVLMRVLIGPFESGDALKEKKAQLEAEGIDTFVREY
jgi:cell division septation protein DedD